jgi:hypothetical protein
MPLLQAHKVELLLCEGVKGHRLCCHRHSLSCCPSSRQSCSCLKHVTVALGCTAWPNHAGLHQETVTGSISPHTLHSVSSQQRPGGEQTATSDCACASFSTHRGNMAGRSLRL